MNDVAGDGEQQLRAFIDLIERDRALRCRQILAEAEAQGRELVRAARHEAARRVRAALADERDRARGRVDAARAELATNERRRNQKLAQGLLEQAWVGLRRELSERWQGTESRGRWTAALVGRGLRILPKACWLIEHPEGLPPPELDPRIAEVSGVCPSVVADPSIAAGLRVTSAGVRLDGSLEGLLADRAGIEGRLLMDLDPPATERGA